MYGLQNNNMVNSEWTTKSINLKPAWHINENGEYVLKYKFFLFNAFFLLKYVMNDVHVVVVVEMMRGAL